MYGKAAGKELSRSEFDSARLGYNQLLRRKRMSPQFIELHADDLFGQAALEYSRHLAEGKKIANPPGWLIVCAWHRTVNLLETRDWRPKVVSIERSGEPVGEPEEGPEEAFLTGDRFRKVRRAVEKLPAHQRHLLALSYFEDESVREAARRLDWTPSKAQRAHESAQRRLYKTLGVESSEELEFEIAVAAYLSLIGGGSTLLRLQGSLEGALDTAIHDAAHALDFVRDALFGSGSSRGMTSAHAAQVQKAHEHAYRAITASTSDSTGAIAVRSGGRRIQELGRRFLGSGAAETAGAATTGEGGRVVEACKAALAVCLLGGSAIGGVVLSHPDHHPHRSVTVRSAPTLASTSEVSIGASAVEPDSVEAEPVAADEARQETAASVQKSPAERRARRRDVEEKKVTGRFDAFGVAGKGTEESGAAATAPLSATASNSGSKPPAVAGESPPQTASVKTEEAATHDEFRPGFR